MRYLMAQVKPKTLVTRATRMMPKWRTDVAYHQKVLQELIRPQIKAIHGEVASGSSSSRKTIMHHPFREFKDGSKPSEQYIDHLVANTEILLFAGHDTTAQTL